MAAFWSVWHGPGSSKGDNLFQNLPGTCIVEFKKATISQTTLSVVSDTVCNEAYNNAPTAAVLCARGNNVNVCSVSSPFLEMAFYQYTAWCKKNSSMFEFTAFLLLTNLGQPMHSPSALT